MPCTTIRKTLKYFPCMTMATYYSNDEAAANIACFHVRAFLLLRLGRGSPPEALVFLNMHIHDITTCGEKANMGMGMNTVYIPSLICVGSSLCMQ